MRSEIENGRHLPRGALGVGGCGSGGGSVDGTDSALSPGLHGSLSAPLIEGMTRRGSPLVEAAPGCGETSAELSRFTVRSRNQSSKLRTVQSCPSRYSSAILDRSAEPLSMHRHNASESCSLRLTKAVRSRKSVHSHSVATSSAPATPPRASSQTNKPGKNPSGSGNGWSTHRGYHTFSIGTRASQPPAGAWQIRSRAGSHAL